MNKLAVSALLSTLLFSSMASATLLFDQNVTNDVIFGSGNANGAFTINQNNGVELGLRAKLRHNAVGDPENTFNSNGDGTYSFAAGVAPTQSAPTAVWSFEWSINSNFDGSGGMLDSFTYLLSLDKDPGVGVDMLNFDPINQIFADHAIGNNSTGNGGGTVATDPVSYSSLIANNNLAQNSWKPHWFLADFGFDPTLDATYDFTLTAFDGNGAEAASTSMQVIVGNGATDIPEPSTTAMLMLGMLGLAFRKKKAE